MELKSWYSICIPHEDIKKGNLDESVFAIDLWGAVTGNAPEVYQDSEEFFKKTYFTEGLKTVLIKAAKALYGNSESSDRILGLQTSFGGGKTHLLLSLYHLAKSRNIKELLTSFSELDITEIEPAKTNTAIFTNKTCDATQGRILPDGTHLRTIWGEIAYQLGGKELYAVIEENDKNRICPQGLFEKILSKASPCLILADELADYCVAASGIKIEKTTLADQTISFIQQLGGAVAKTPKTMMVATLPASNIEVSSNKILAQTILDALENRYFREAIGIKPVQDEEIYEVIRKRLFDSIGDEKEAVAKAYYTMYKEHSYDLPSESSKPAYKNLIARSYPFHPELIESLYHRWGSHPLFQRTRGVLRLLATLVAEQWHRKNANPQKCALIQPNHIQWTSESWSETLRRLWGEEYKAVVAADITGENSNAFQTDKQRGEDYETERITEGIASAILLNSFGSRPERSGLTLKEIKSACSQPHLNWAIIEGAVTQLEEKAFYLHTAGGQEKRLWFNIKPTINKLIHQYSVTMKEKNFFNEIEDHLRKNIIGASQNFKILVNPGTDLADQKPLTLVILPPSVQWIEKSEKNPAQESILQISKFCGNKERLYRNTLIFLALTKAGARSLQDAFCESEVIESVLKDYKSRLDSEQKAELKTKSESAKKFLENTYSSAYTVIAKVEKDNVCHFQLSEPESGLKSLFESVWKKLVEEEWIQTKIGTVTFEECGLIPKEGGIRVKDAADYFLRYTDKPMIPNTKVVIDAIAKAVNDGKIGIGTGTSLNSISHKYCKEFPANELNDEGVWIIPRFEPEVNPPKPEETEQFSKTYTEETEKKEDTGIKEKNDKNGETIKKIIISGDVPLEEWNQIFRSFIQPSNQMNLKKQKLSVQFEFEPGSGNPVSADDNKVKAMKESAGQLGLNIEIK